MILTGNSKGRFNASSLIIVICLILAGHSSSAQKSALKQPVTEYDRLLSEQFKSNETGCAALVAREGRIIYHKAFGMADLELNVPMKPDMVFRIGSITKQFTSVAILQLMEQGKLSLQDEITKFIPDYPVHGHKITIEHLLTHTSGIKSYTSMSEIGQFMRRDMKPEEVIGLFRNQPMDFAPGTRYNYNNSGYFLLGYIIEKVSGKSYPEYIEENFFRKLGMNNSYYGSNSRIIKNRASGYSPDANGVINAEIMSMTIPYAAGSILSTVEDLFKWNQALHSYKLINKETLEKAFTEYKLTDGRGTEYGYGWGLKKIQGSPTIEHGGGINGFLTNAIYLPEEDVFVALFSNSNGKSPNDLSVKMAALAIDKPYTYKDITLDEAVLEEYTGVYENDQGDLRLIIREGNQLFSQRAGSSRLKIKPYEKDRFFFEDSFVFVDFERDNQNRVIKAVNENRGTVTVWKRTDRKWNERTAIRVPESILAQYAGDYELAPGFLISVTLEGDRLFTQATGQGKIEVYAESETKFFLKVVDAQLEFVKGDDGNVVSVILYQGGQKVEGKKIR